MTANAADRRANKLLGFYVDKSRDLPWRARPGGPAPDPYRVWLSEIMLQQTTVAAVTTRFARFVERWPTVQALAAASDEDVLQEWAGLGYYARARNLIACAKVVAEAGGFPRTAAELRKLPGVGAYTAAAVAAIAFGEQAAPVDTNVERVLARLHTLKEPSRRETERLFLDLAPEGRAGDIAQALMDLGATVCRPRQPRCGECPVNEACGATASGRPDDFPAPKIRAARPQRFGIAWWIEQDNRVWLVRRPSKGLLGGMAALPGSEWRAEQTPTGTPLAQLRHVFTHFSLQMSVVAVAEPPTSEGWWHPIEKLDEAGLPTLYRRAAEVVLGQAGRSRNLA